MNGVSVTFCRAPIPYALRTICVLMSNTRLLFVDHLFLSTLIGVLSIPITSSSAWKRNNHLCLPSYCGNLKISYPFRLKSDAVNCGDPNFVLDCEDNHTMVTLYSDTLSANCEVLRNKFYVQSIDYNKRTIRITNIHFPSDLCSYMTSTSFTYRNNCMFYKIYNGMPACLTGLYQPRTMVFLTCSSQVQSPLYVDISSCNSTTSEIYPNSSFPMMKRYHYVFFGGKLASDLPDSCTVDAMVMTSSPQTEKKAEAEVEAASLETILRELAYGLELSWDPIRCKECRGDACLFDENMKLICCEGVKPTIMSYITGIISSLPPFLECYLIARCLCCIPCIASYLIYKVRRRNNIFDDIEDYLQGHNNLTTIRYSYSEIKFITRGFKEKLGEGAHGSVFKGWLRSGREVAVKLLGNPKADGREFINEIGTIGRIHHLNVVQLIGFCTKGSKRAIVYDFMPNGSLEKYIFSELGESDQISCEKMFEISLGIAHGVEYLHRGCDMRILHFDIKPHNILLDENFIPKISDFGLAKLYATDDSIVHLTAARGTVGYMAPELFYKNIGGISFKADVYSFGMLLMEMVGRRKNWNELTDNSSQTYFPLWVYDQISAGKTIEILAASEQENKLAEKMLNVSLWCIQMNPRDRPSMSRVVEMLEGNVADLEIPPRPFLCTEYMPAADNQNGTNQDELSIVVAHSDSINLVIDS